MEFKETTVAILEDCIKNELLPVYNRYFYEKNVEPPTLSIEVLKVLKNNTPALLRPWPLQTGVLASSSDRRVAKK